MSKRLRIIVLGAMGRIPFAGMGWETLNYLSGLHRLGHEVWYVEDTNAWPYDTEQDSCTPDCSYTLRYIDRLMQWAGLAGRWAYRVAEPDGRIYGVSDSQFWKLFQHADALINLGTSTRLQDPHLAVPVRILMQTDPGGDEILAAQGDPDTVDLLVAHTHLFTRAANWGASDCCLPSGPFSYRVSLMPVVLDWFNAPSQSRSEGKRPLKFTTVANWHQTGEIEWDGEIYAWSKRQQFLRFINLPCRLEESIELALGSADEEAVQLLTSRGWRVIDAASFTADIFPLRDYIFGSDGEFTVAKDQYVRLRTGWFGDRSAYYLAAGKPVITQETGFSKFLPTGEGLFAFDTLEDVIASFDAIHSDYERHSRAARAIAEEYFRADTVLATLINDVGL